MNLVVIYGPPASGKLTVAQELSAITGYKLFHNHLTVNAVAALFEFGTPEFTRLLRQIRLALLTAAARADINAILTLNSAHAEFPRYTEEMADQVRAKGGKVLFVNLSASVETLESRISLPSRFDHGKLTDIVRLRELLGYWNGEPLNDSDLSIDNTSISAKKVAEQIVSHFSLPSQADSS